MRGVWEGGGPAGETPATRTATNRSGAALPNNQSERRGPRKPGPPPDLRSPRQAPPAGSLADRCPAPGVGRTPREGGYLFGVVALVRVGAAFEVRSAVEFRAEAVGEACGEEAVAEG